MTHPYNETHTYLALNGAKLCGAVETGDPVDWLPGKTVTMMLDNGVVVTGVTLLPWVDLPNRARQYRYQLPSAGAVSTVSTHAVNCLYVHHSSYGLNSPPANIYVHVGDVRPTILG